MNRLKVIEDDFFGPESPGGFRSAQTGTRTPNAVFPVLPRAEELG